jgi:BirA family biotin operon repressor/biotin-[acetyl-CoA-carboxylase] ligase
MTQQEGLAQVCLTESSATQWSCESIWQALEPKLPGFTVEVLPEIDSTNAELMRRAQAGCADPVLLVAEFQTAGRGRLGRQWHSSRGQHGLGSLTFSLGLPLAPVDWSGLSLAVGLSVAQSLHPDIMLKWPNDLWWHDRKLAGILIETIASNRAVSSSGRYVVIGVGLNIACPPATGLATEPVGLLELLSQCNAAQALACIAAPLVQTILRFEHSGFAPFQESFNARDALSQVAVNLSDGTQGVAQGVDRSGALQVKTAGGLQRVTSAEVSVRPVRRQDDCHL